MSYKTRRKKRQIRMNSKRRRSMNQRIDDLVRFRFAPGQVPASAMRVQEDDRAVR